MPKHRVRLLERRALHVCKCLNLPHKLGRLMWLVIAALRRPISILVMAITIALSAGVGIRKMPIDIFPVLGMPVIYVAQPCGGLDPSQMEGFISSYYEYHFLYITGIKEVESRSIQGVSLIKLVFYRGSDMSQAAAETVAEVNRARAFMPPGTVAPFVVRFDAGSVPVGNLVFSSQTRTLGEIQDLALFKVRPMFASLPGVSAPPPMGGNQRTIVVHVDPEKLRQYHLSADQVVQAINTGAQPASYPIDTICLWTSGPHEAVMSVALKKNSGVMVAQLKERLRRVIGRKFTDLSISFEPGDLVGQVTNLGAQTPVEIAIVGKNLADNKAFADKLKVQLAKIPEMRDLQLGEALTYPALNVNIDRIRAGRLGVTVDQVARSLVAFAFSEGSEQTAPLGRAVIGGLAASTFATLLILPLVFSAMRGKSTTVSASLDPDDPASPVCEKTPEGQE